MRFSKSLLLLALIFNQIYFLSFSQDFKKFTQVIDTENNIHALENIKKQEEKKYHESNNKYHLYNVWYLDSRILSLSGHEDEALKKLFSIVEDCPNCKTNQMAWIHYQLAAIFQDYNPKLTEEYALKGIELAKISKANDELPWLYDMIGVLHYRQKNFKKAKTYFTCAQQYVSKTDTVKQASVINNAALCEMMMNQNNLALEHFEHALKIMKTIRKPDQISKDFQIIVEGNIGSLLHNLKRNREAITLLEKEIDYDLRNNKKSDAAKPMVELLEIYTEENMAAEQKVILKKLQILEPQIHGESESTLILKAIIKHYLNLKNQNMALHYAQKLNERLQDFHESSTKRAAKLNQILFSEKIKQFKKETKTQEKLLSLAVKEKKQSQYLLVALLILFVFISLGINYRIRENRKRAKKDALILEQQRQLELNKQIILENEVKLQQDKIFNLAMNLNLKKETEKAFLSKVKELKKRKNVEIDEVVKELQISINNLLQIDNKTLYHNLETDDVNRSFKEALSKLHPELNNHDLSFCCYFRMELSGKEIAALNQMTEGSVRVLKNKIKNKIGLDKETSLNEYLQAITIES